MAGKVKPKRRITKAQLQILTPILKGCLVSDRRLIRKAARATGLYVKDVEQWLRDQGGTSTEREEKASGLNQKEHNFVSSGVGGNRESKGFRASSSRSPWTAGCSFGERKESANSKYPKVFGNIFTPWDGDCTMKFVHIPPPLRLPPANVGSPAKNMVQSSKTAMSCKRRNEVLTSSRSPDSKRQRCGMKAVLGGKSSKSHRSGAQSHSRSIANKNQSVVTRPHKRKRSGKPNRENKRQRCYRRA